MVALALGLVLLTSAPAPARIKLVALPERASITLSVEHPDANLVQEERVLTLQKGVNQIDFNWQGVSIDADAITLEPLEHPGEIQLISVKYPPNENALVWDVYAPRAMTERVRVTYFLSGITREYSYRAVADQDEKNLALKESVRLRNSSGERLENVRILTPYAAPYTTDLDYGEMRQTLLNSVTVPFTRTFTWDAAEKPHDPSKVNTTVGIPIRYVVKNDAEHRLGTSALPYGKARIFQEDSRGGTAFIGEDWGAYTPVTEKMELFVGESRDIKVTRKQKNIERTRERRNSDNRVVLFDQKETYEVTVENFRNKEVTVTVLDHFAETWDVASASSPWTRKDAGTLQFEVPLKASDSTVITFVVERRNLSPDRPLR